MCPVRSVTYVSGRSPHAWCPLRASIEVTLGERRAIAFCSITADLEWRMLARSPGRRKLGRHRLGLKPSRSCSFFSVSLFFEPFFRQPSFKWLGRNLTTLEMWCRHVYCRHIPFMALAPLIISSGGDVSK